MKISFFLDTKFCKLQFQSSQESMQKCPVFFPGSISIPAKNLLTGSVFFRHNLRRSGRSPLGKKMRQLKETDAAAFSHFHPAIQFFKAKRIASICLNGHIHQLDGPPLSAHSRIKRRRKDRGQKHVVTMLHCCLYEIFHDSPVFLRENLLAIIISETVAVEPLRMRNLHGRKHSSDDLQRDVFFRQNLPFMNEADCHRILACFHILRNLHIDPEASPLAINQRNVFINIFFFVRDFFQHFQPVRIKPRRSCEIVLIHNRAAGIFTGNQRYLPKLYIYPNR